MLTHRDAFAFQNECEVFQFQYRTLWDILAAATAAAMACRDPLQLLAHRTAASRGVPWLLVDH